MLESNLLVKGVIVRGVAVEKEFCFLPTMPIMADASWIIQAELIIVIVD